MTIGHSIKIRTLWFLEDGDDVMPELLCAWDEYCIDENPQGYEEDMKKAHGSRGTDGEYRYIELSVDYDKIMKAFRPVKVKADVGFKLRQVDEDSRDGLDQLSDALYGREPKAAEYLGGADAKILRDAALEIQKLRGSGPIKTKTVKTEHYTQCRRMMSWAGRCQSTDINDNGFCANHAKDRCHCGKQATKECGHAGQFVCGAPLCDDCKCTAAGH
mgnify:CR=1 FL=1|tara:strand:- start:46637 stop:47284 length:648 start_codon:yes stop_codon:yes gene_type:complete